MKRTFALIAALVLLVSLFSACGKSEPKDIDLDSLDAALAEKSPFLEALEPVDADIGCMILTVDEADCEKAVMRFSSGATAEEYALIKAKDSAALGRIEKALKEHIAFQKTSFAGYVPSEVPKIEAAILSTKGNYIIYCVADDAKAAQDIIDLYLR